MENTSRGPGRTNHFREAQKYVIFSLPGDGARAPEGPVPGGVEEGEGAQSQGRERF